MSEEKQNIHETTETEADDASDGATAVAAVALAELKGMIDDPSIDLARQNEQTVAQTNAINDAVKATQVGEHVISTP